MAAAHSCSCCFPSLCWSPSSFSFTALDLAGGDEEKAQLPELSPRSFWIPETTIILLYLSWKMDSFKVGEISKEVCTCPNMLWARGSEVRRT